MIKLTRVIPTQQDNPIKIGFPPVLTRFTIFVFKPIAAMAIIIKNLDKSFNGVKTSIGTPKAVAIVVISDAPTKKRMKNGKTFLKDTF